MSSNICKPVLIFLACFISSHGSAYVVGMYLFFGLILFIYDALKESQMGSVDGTK